MERKFVIEAIKIALIASIKEKMHEEGLHCKSCDTPFMHLHRIPIRGIGTIHLCEGCVEELQEFFKKRESQAFDDIFKDQIRMILGQHKEYCRIPEDMEDYGSYYGHAKYKLDH